MYRRKPQALGDLIEDFIESVPNRKSMKRGMIRAFWREEVGDSIADQTDDMWFKGDLMFVRIKNPAWRHEVHMQRFVIAQRLNKRVKEEIIQDIIIKS